MDTNINDNSTTYKAIDSHTVEITINTPTVQTVDLDAINAEISDLQSQIDDQNNTIASAQTRITFLQSKIDADNALLDSIKQNVVLPDSTPTPDTTPTDLTPTFNTTPIDPTLQDNTNAS